MSYEVPKHDHTCSDLLTHKPRKEGHSLNQEIDNFAVYDVKVLNQAMRV